MYVAWNIILSSRWFWIISFTRWKLITLDLEYNHKLIILLVYGFHLFVVSAHDTFLGIVNHIYLGHFEFVWSLSLQHFKATAWLWAFKMWKYNLYFAYCHRWVTSINHFNCEPMFVMLTLREIQLLFLASF